MLGDVLTAAGAPVSILPTAGVCPRSVNHMLPSAPGEIRYGYGCPPAFSPTVNRVIAPAVVILPM
jgi:hypothetical protein